MPQAEDHLVMYSKYIHELKRIAIEAENIAKLESQWDEEFGILINFPWLREKFEFFWFKSREIEDKLRTKLPDEAFFSPLEFEKLVRSVLYLTQSKIYIETPKTRDGGIDLIYKECIDQTWGAYETTLVQCKLYRGYVPISEVRDFFGVISANTASGLFVTTGKFTNQAYDFLPMANKSPHSNSICAIDGIVWDGLFKIAKECHTIMEHSSNSDTQDITLATINKIRSLRNKAQSLMQESCITASQEDLF